jgi:hypothetical protein
MKIEIYDPPMCCSSGICGPAVDPALLKMNDAVLALKKQGVTIERFNLKSDFLTFKDNARVMALLHESGTKILPVTMIKGKLFKTCEYPTYEELCEEFNIEPLKANKPLTLRID